MKELLDDDREWMPAEWMVRWQWVYELIECYESILSQKALRAEHSMFWIRLWGFLTEFPKIDHGGFVVDEFGIRAEQGKIAEAIEKVGAVFTEDEKIIILDYRIHAAHTVSSFWRLAPGKNGKINDMYEKRSRKDIQSLLEAEYRKHSGENLELGAQNTALAYAKKIDLCDLKEIEKMVYRVAIKVNPKARLVIGRNE